MGVVTVFHIQLSDSTSSSSSSSAVTSCSSMKSACMIVFLCLAITMVQCNPVKRACENTVDEMAGMVFTCLSYLENLNYSNMCSKLTQAVNCYDDMLRGCSNSELRSMGLLDAYNQMKTAYNDSGCN